MKRDRWLEIMILSSKAEQDRWIQAAGVSVNDWDEGQDLAVERFQRWVRRAFDAAAKKVKKK